MATISVPLSPKQQECLDTLVAEGAGANRADVMRRALEKFAEDEAVKAVVEAEQEVREGKILRGDLRKILLDT